MTSVECIHSQQSVQGVHVSVSHRGPTACRQFGPRPSPVTFPAVPSNIGFVLSVCGFLSLATGYKRVIRRLLAAVQIGRVFVSLPSVQFEKSLKSFTDTVGITA